MVVHDLAILMGAGMVVFESDWLDYEFIFVLIWFICVYLIVYFLFKEFKYYMYLRYFIVGVGVLLVASFGGYFRFLAIINDDFKTVSGEFDGIVSGVNGNQQHIKIMVGNGYSITYNSRRSDNCFNKPINVVGDVVDFKKFREHDNKIKFGSTPDFLSISYLGDGRDPCIFKIVKRTNQAGTATN